MSRLLTLTDFDFDLPPELIAQTATATRSASRLLDVVADVQHGAPMLHDRRFAELPQLLEPGDLLVFNDTRVLKARLFGHKASGGAVEVLVERITGEQTALAQIRASKSPRPGTELALADGRLTVIVGERVAPFHTLHFPGDCAQLLEQYGRLPLPPYITHDPDAADETRYQTIYAATPGAVAAPTAGLHFDDGVFAALDARGVQRGFLTLHVGAGTFAPVRTENLAEHKMHSEPFVISPELAARIGATRAAGKRVVAVGTTSLRALEAAATPDGNVAAGAAATEIFITPGYRFRVVDALVTNFHLPKSTLLMLVAALTGYDTMRAAYAHAIAARYRFFSYGDAMFVRRTPSA